ncbi:MAG TPA: polysaccharide biosynthesis/export family protein [Gemmatimonadales bacterium]|nr:polysaccharide biosynthesis/export family protein [Gemmatimonadales bacterium]
MREAIAAGHRSTTSTARTVVGSVVLCLALAGMLQGQDRPAADSAAAPDTLGQPTRAMATRAELEAIAAGKSGPVTPELQQQVKDRLEKGDLRPGDRVALRVVGEQALADTFTVTPERTLELPNIPEFSVANVLRSELEAHLVKQLGRYIRDVDLQAAALVRVSVVGAVGRPGFYNLPADVLASDAIMAAGGPVAKADVAKTTLRRGGVEIGSEAQIATAVQSGQSLDQLNVQSGDELVVGAASEGMRGVLRTFGLISGALFGIVAVSRLF